MSILQYFLAVVAAAVLSVLVEWLLRSILPTQQTPVTRLIILFIGLGVAMIAAWPSITTSLSSTNAVPSKASTGNCPLPQGIAEPTDTNPYIAPFDDLSAAGFRPGDIGAWIPTHENSNSKNGVYHVINQTAGTADARGFYSNFLDGLIEYRFMLIDHNEEIEDSGKISFTVRGRLIPDTEKSQFYSVDFIPNRRRAQVTYVDERLEDWPIINMSVPNLDLVDNEWNCVFVDVQNNVFEVFLNGNNILRAEAPQDQQLGLGGLGLAVGPYADVYFDDIRVWKSTNSINPPVEAPTAAIITSTPTVSSTSAPTNLEDVLFMRDFEGVEVGGFAYKQQVPGVGSSNIIDDGGNHVFETQNLSSDSATQTDLLMTELLQNGNIDFRFRYMELSPTGEEDDGGFDVHFRVQPTDAGESIESYVLAVRPHLPSASPTLELYYVDENDNWDDNAIFLNSFQLDLEKWYYLRIKYEDAEIKVYLSDAIITESTQPR